MKSYNENKGFTLIELIIVVIILGVLAGLVTPKLYSWIVDSKVKTAVQNMAMVEKIENTLFLKTGTIDGIAGSTPTNESITAAIESYLTNEKKLGDMGMYVNTYINSPPYFEVRFDFNWGSSDMIVNGETVKGLGFSSTSSVVSAFGTTPGFSVPRRGMPSDLYYLVKLGQ